MSVNILYGAPSGGPVGATMYTPPRVLRIVHQFFVTDANGGVKNHENHYDFAFLGTGGVSPAASQKAALAASGAPSNFKSQVLAFVLAAMNPSATTVNILAKWLDIPLDPYQVVDSTATPGSGTAGDALPMLDCVTFRKNVGLATRTWSRGSWHFGPVSEADTTFDELNTSTGKTNWATNLAPKLLLPINDGVSTLVPVLISQKNSQILTVPTLIVCAPLIAPSKINSTIGTMRKRKERPTGVIIV